MNERLERLRMERFYKKRLARNGVRVGWGTHKNGEYVTEYAQNAWAAWREARRPLEFSK